MLEAQHSGIVNITGRPGFAFPTLAALVPRGSADYLRGVRIPGLPSVPHLALLNAALVSLVLACASERKEKAECVAARRDANQQALSGNLKKAQESLSQAREVCGKTSEYDFERIERMLERQQRKLETPTESDRSAPIEAFLQWVEGLREASNKAGAPPDCAPRGSKDYGFCSSKHQVSGQVFGVRYRTDDPKAYRFEANLPLLASCVDMGRTRPLANWKEGTSKYELCELESHGLLGLRALIEHDDQKPGNSRIWVYPEEYLARDSALQHLTKNR
jgi:hypothetical protein